MTSPTPFCEVCPEVVPMSEVVVIIVLCTTVVAICKMIFGLVALRGVAPKQRPEIIRAVGDAWGRWRPR